MVTEPGKIVLSGEIDIGITLIILEPDVVTRLEAFDLIIFEDQGLFLSVRYRDFDTPDLCDHGTRLWGSVCTREIT